MTEIVDFEIAKLLFVKDYQELPKSYNSDGKLITVSHIVRRITKTENVYYPAPTIAQVVDWLFEKYNIWIIVTPIPYCEGLTHWRWEHKSTDYNTRGFHWKKQSDYLSPKEAYLEAIRYILNNLI